MIRSFGTPVQRDCCARAIFVPGEPAAAFAQMLLVRLAIVLGAARKALRCQVTRGSRAGSGFRDFRQQFTVNSSPQRSSEQARRQGYSPFLSFAVG